MTEEFEYEELPRVSRSISIISGRIPGRESGSGGLDEDELLPPFSGVLEMRAGPGRAPMLDLSYLTLDALLAPALDSASGGMQETAAIDPGIDAATTQAIDESGETPHDGRGELTVKEVIHGERGSEGTDSNNPFQSDTRNDRHDASAGGTESDAGTIDNSVLGTGINTTVKRFSSVTDIQQSADGRNVAEQSAEQPGRQSTDRPTGQQSNQPTGQTTNSAETPESSFGTVREAGDPTAQDAFGSNPSGPTRPRMRTGRDASGQWEDGRRTGSPGESATTTVVDSSSGVSGMEEQGEMGPGSTRPSSSRQQSGEVGPASQRGMGPITPDGKRPSAQSATVRSSDAAGDGPRMVVDTGGGSSGDSTDGLGPDGTASGRHRDDGPGPHQPPGGRHIDPIDESAIMQASTDPDSRLVDRLYESLKERDAIERRREGGR